MQSARLKRRCVGGGGGNAIWLNVILFALWRLVEAFALHSNVVLEYRTVTAYPDTI